MGIPNGLGFVSEGEWNQDVVFYWCKHWSGKLLQPLPFFLSFLAAALVKHDAVTGTIVLPLQPVEQAPKDCATCLERLILWIECLWFFRPGCCLTTFSRNSKMTELTDGDSAYQGQWLTLITEATIVSFYKTQQRRLHQVVTKILHTTPWTWVILPYSYYLLHWCRSYGSAGMFFPVTLNNNDTPIRWPYCITGLRISHWYEDGHVRLRYCFQRDVTHEG